MTACLILRWQNGADPSSNRLRHTPEDALRYLAGEHMGVHVKAVHTRAAGPKVSLQKTVRIITRHQRDFARPGRRLPFFCRPALPSPDHVFYELTTAPATTIGP